MEDFNPLALVVVMALLPAIPLLVPAGCYLLIRALVAMGRFLLEGGAVATHHLASPSP